MLARCKIAVATPHKPLRCALAEQGLKSRQTIAAGGIELIDGGGIKSAHVAKFCGVAVDEGWNRTEPGYTVGALRIVVGSQDCIGNGAREGWFDCPGGKRHGRAIAPRQTASFRPPIQPGYPFRRFQEAPLKLRVMATTRGRAPGALPALTLSSSSQARLRFSSVE
jgi:hypothetical protein